MGLRWWFRGSRDAVAFPNLKGDPLDGLDITFAGFVGNLEIIYFEDGIIR